MLSSVLCGPFALNMVEHFITIGRESINWRGFCLMVEKVRERKVAIRFLSTFERLQRTRLGKICSMHHLKYAAPYKVLRSVT